MFTANPHFKIFLGTPPFFNSHRHQLAYTSLIEALEGIVGKYVLIEVLSYKTADIVPGIPEGHLCQIVRSKGEEVSIFSNFIGRKSRPRDLNHSTDFVVQSAVVLFQHLLHHLFGVFTKNFQLIPGTDQGNHYFREYFYSLLLYLTGGFHNRLYLHIVDFGVGNTQPAAAMSEHRVHLFKILGHLLDGLRFKADFIGKLLNIFISFRNKFMERRVKQANGHRQTLHRLEDTDKVLLLQGKHFIQGLLAGLLALGYDHFLKYFQLAFVEEHMFGPAEANTFGAEMSGLFSISRCISVGTNSKALLFYALAIGLFTHIVGPGEKLR